MLAMTSRTHIITAMSARSHCGLLDTRLVQFLAAPRIILHLPLRDQWANGKRLQGTRYCPEGRAIESMRMDAGP